MAAQGEGEANYNIYNIYMSRSHGVFDFIQSQSSLFVNKLYGNVNDKSETAQAAWVCRGVLQSLCPLAKCYVMRLVFIETPISSIDIWRWCEPGHKSEHDSALKELIQLRVFVEVDKPDEVDAQEDEQWFVLNQYFRESIKYGMLSLSSPWQEDVTTVTTVKSMVKTEKENEENLPMETDEGVHNCEKADGPAVEELEMVSYSRWNTILEFLVTADESLKISSSVVSYLLAAGLMQTRGDMPPLKRSKGLHSNKINRNLSITSKGYEYMLLDIQSQVWLYVLQCLKNSENNQIELLRLVFVLSFCNVGTGYPVGLLSHSQKSLISDLHEIGIVHIPPAKSTESELYYPTHIAINVLSVAPPSANNDSLPDNAINSMSLTIIVETNFQVVAYINTSLHMAMLSLFVDTRTMMHLPNMVRQYSLSVLQCLVQQASSACIHCL